MPKVRVKYYSLLTAAIASPFIFFILFDVFKIEIMAYVGFAIYVLCGVLILLIKCPRCGKSVMFPEGNYLHSHPIPEKNVLDVAMI